MEMVKKVMLVVNWLSVTDNIVIQQDKTKIEQKSTRCSVQLEDHLRI